MAFVQDWVIAAAREIASHWSFGSGPDSYITDDQKHHIASNFAAMINKHCPFEPDVAYMPVPRCDQCKHWTPILIGAQAGRATGRGLCNALSPPLVTDDSFGCVQWGAK